MQETSLTSDACLIITLRLFKNYEDGSVDVNFSDELSSGSVFNDFIKLQGEWIREHADAESMQIAQPLTVVTKSSLVLSTVQSRSRHTSGTKQMGSPKSSLN